MIQKCGNEVETRPLREFLYGSGEVSQLIGFEFFIEGLNGSTVLIEGLTVIIEGTRDTHRYVCPDRVITESWAIL